MGKKIEIEWPSLDIKVEADLLTDKNPELCEQFWAGLPFESLQMHVILAGDEICCYPPFPPVDDPKLVKYTIPIREARPGTIIWSKMGHLCIYYGPVGEPWTTIPIGQVREEDLEKVKQVGEAQWESHCFSKKIITAIFKRKEE